MMERGVRIRTVRLQQSVSHQRAGELLLSASVAPSAAVDGPADSPWAYSQGRTPLTMRRAVQLDIRSL